MSSNLLCRTVFWYSLITCACHLLLSVTKTLFPLHRAILFVNKLIYATAKRDNKKTGKSDNWKFKRNDCKTVHMRCRLIEWYQFYTFAQRFVFRLFHLLLIVVFIRLELIFSLSIQRLNAWCWNRVPCVRFLKRFMCAIVYSIWTRLFDMQLTMSFQAMRHGDAYVFRNIH